MDASRNSARNELKEFSLRFINVLVNILASQWSRNDEGENRIDSNNKAVEHSLCFLLARRLVRGVIAPTAPLLLPGAVIAAGSKRLASSRRGSLSGLHLCGKRRVLGRFAQSRWEKYTS